MVAYIQLASVLLLLLAPASTLAAPIPAEAAKLVLVERGFSSGTSNPLSKVLPLPSLVSKKPIRSLPIDLEIIDRRALGLSKLAGAAINLTANATTTLSKPGFVSRPIRLLLRRAFDLLVPRALKSGSSSSSSSVVVPVQGFVKRPLVKRAEEIVLMRPTNTQGQDRALQTRLAVAMKGAGRREKARWAQGAVVKELERREAPDV